MTPQDPDLQRLEDSDLSLLELLDHVLDKGLVISGEITISVADVDLIFVGLNLLLGSVETIRETLDRRLAGVPVRPETALPAGGATEVGG